MPYRIDYLKPLYNSFLNNTFKKLNPKARSLGYWLRNIDTVCKEIDSKKSIRTQATYYCAVLSFLKYHKKKILSGKISKKIKELSQEIQHKLGKQELLTGRKHFSTDEMNNFLNELKTKYEEDKTNNKNNISYLALALYVKHPPNRNLYSSMEFKKVNIVNNYIDLDNKQFIIQRDKVSKYCGGARISISDELYNIILDSIESYPREYLLSSFRDPDKPLGYRGLYNILKRVHNKLNIDTLRSSYITEFYKTNPNRNQQKELAVTMRHSRNTQDLCYNKLPSTELNFNE